MRARKRQYAERGKGNPQAVDNDHQKESPTGSCWCPKNIEGDLAQRAENLESSFNVKQIDSLSDVTETAESTREGFISLSEGDYGKYHDS